MIRVVAWSQPTATSEGVVVPRELVGKGEEEQQESPEDRRHGRKPGQFVRVAKIHEEEGEYKPLNARDTQAHPDLGRTEVGEADHHGQARESGEEQERERAGGHARRFGVIVLENDRFLNVLGHICGPVQGYSM